MQSLARLGIPASSVKSHTYCTHTFAMCHVDESGLRSYADIDLQLESMRCSKLFWPQCKTQPGCIYTLHVHMLSFQKTMDDDFDMNDEPDTTCSATRPIY